MLPDMRCPNLITYEIATQIHPHFFEVVWIDDESQNHHEIGPPRPEAVCSFAAVSLKNICSLIFKELPCYYIVP
jgi:hypothetical protein